LQGRGLGG